MRERERHVHGSILFETIASGQLAVSTHPEKRQIIDSLDITDAAKKQKHSGLDNAAIIAGQFAVCTHPEKRRIIDDSLDITDAAKKQKQSALDNMSTLYRMTKHAAKKLSAAAVTVDQKKLGASAMAKVTKKGTTRVQEELDAAEDALDEIRKEWPEFGVVTQAAGKQWPETEPAKDDIVLGFQRWRNTLKMPEVRQRIEHGLLQQNAARRQIVRNFSNAMKTYGSAIFAQDKEVRAAKAAKLTEEQHEESDD